MSDYNNTVISAQVVLQPADGKKIPAELPITAENLAKFAPSPATVAAATELFRSGGFEVGPMAGISFSVTGPLPRFEEFFGMHLRLAADGAYEFIAGKKSLGHELAGQELPEELRALAAFVVFPLPPDFGPSSF